MRGQGLRDRLRLAWVRGRAMFRAGARAMVKLELAGVHLAGT